MYFLTLNHNALKKTAIFRISFTEYGSYDQFRNLSDHKSIG